MIKKQAFYKKLLTNLKRSKRAKGVINNLILGAGAGTAATAGIGIGILAIQSATKDRYLPKGLLR